MKNLLHSTLLCLFLSVAQVGAQSITEYTEKQIEELGSFFQDQTIYLEEAKETLLEEGVTEDFLGMIVLYSGVNPQVVVLADGDHGPEVAYRMVFRSRKRTKLSDRLDRSLNTEEATLWFIQQDALDHMNDPCPGDYRVLISEDPDGVGYLAFCYREQENEMVIPMGGFYRLHYSNSGVFESAERLSEGCVDFHYPVGSKKRNAIRVAHHLSEMPCELHTFTSLHYRHEVLVYMGNKDMWTIRNGKMKQERMR